MADNIIVFDPETKTAKVNAKGQLMISDTLPPSLKGSEDEQKEYGTATPTQKYSSPTTNNAVNGATQEDFEDLALYTLSSSSPLRQSLPFALGDLGRSRFRRPAAPARQ